MIGIETEMERETEIETEAETEREIGTEMWIEIGVGIIGTKVENMTEAAISEIRASVKDEDPGHIA